MRKGMSALASIADMCSALGYVCFVPIADIWARQMIRAFSSEKARNGWSPFGASYLQAAGNRFTFFQR